MTINRRTSDASYGAFLNEMKDTLHNALSGLHSDGKIVPVTDHLEYKFSFVESWNAFANNGLERMEGWRKRELMSDLHRMFVKEIFNYKFRFMDKNPNLSEDSPVLTAYLREEFAKLLEAGDIIKPWQSIEAHGPVTSEKVYVTLHAWHPRFQKYDPEAGAFSDLEDLSVKPITHLEIDLPTGELLISDWFRIKEFTDVMQAQSGFNICYAQQRIERTIEGVRKYNVMEVAYSGGIPSVVVGRDRSSDDVNALRIGALDVDEFTDEPLNADLEVSGTVTPEYRATTLIDPADLVSLIALEVGKSEAEAKVAGFIANPPLGKRTTIAKVEPGIWHLYFVDPDAADINRLEQGTDALGTGMETTVMLSREPVSFDEDLVRHELPEGLATQSTPRM